MPFVAMIILFLLKRDVAKLMFLGVVTITMGPFSRVGVIYIFSYKGEGGGCNDYILSYCGVRLQ